MYSYVVVNKRSDTFEKDVEYLRRFEKKKKRRARYVVQLLPNENKIRS